MGFRVVVLLGFVLLLSGEALCDAHNWLNYIHGETLNQIPTGPLHPRSAHTPRHQANRLEQRSPVLFPTSYPAVGPVNIDERVRPPARVRNPQRPEARKLNPDLNPAAGLGPKVLVIFEQRFPVPADSVAVHCGEGGVTVEVKQDFLGNGQLIHPADLTLGGCAALNATKHVLLFQAELQGCGSTMTMTEEALIYSFSLTYSPRPIHNTFILKTNPAEVVIECHYPRRQYVSSDAARPTWEPFASDRLTDTQLHFSLRLMTEDWQSARPSSVYFLGDVLHVEASVLQAHHVPLRVYVDGCVATLDPDPASQPRHPFISHHGCLTDAKRAGAKSYFLPRSQEDKLQFQLQTFGFHRDPRTSLYITCRLKATTVSVPVDAEYKACSFLTEANRWVASGGDNKVCSCCETSCSNQRRRRRSLAADTDQRWEGKAALGPILVQDKVLLGELMQMSEFPMGPASLAQTQELTPAASSPSSKALLCGVGAALGVVSLVFAGAITYSRLRKTAGHSVCT